MATTEDQLNELRTTVSLMSMNLDKAVRAMSNLTDRIEGIEQRQAKLAIEEDKMSESDLWIKLGGMLGLDIDAALNALHRIDRVNDRKMTQAMLHGLACLECKGSAVEFSGEWLWEANHCCWSGRAESHPAALIAMLKAHRDG